MKRKLVVVELHVIEGVLLVIHGAAWLSWAMRLYWLENWLGLVAYRRLNTNCIRKLRWLRGALV